MCSGGSWQYSAVAHLDSLSQVNLLRHISHIRHIGSHPDSLYDNNQAFARQQAGLTLSLDPRINADYAACSKRISDQHLQCSCSNTSCFIILLSLQFQEAVANQKVEYLVGRCWPQAVGLTRCVSALLGGCKIHVVGRLSDSYKLRVS